MDRKIISQLIQWKNNPNRKPLVLLGARQVGKTWIMRHFGETEYKKVAYVNCDEEPRMRELFALDYDINRILLVNMQSEYNIQTARKDNHFSSILSKIRAAAAVL